MTCKECHLSKKIISYKCKSVNNFKIFFHQMVNPLILRACISLCMCPNHACGMALERNLNKLSNVILYAKFRQKYEIYMLSKMVSQLSFANKSYKIIDTLTFEDNNSPFVVVSVKVWAGWNLFSVKKKFMDFVFFSFKMVIAKLI